MWPELELEPESEPEQSHRIDYMVRNKQKMGRGKKWWRGWRDFVAGGLRLLNCFFENVTQNEDSQCANTNSGNLTNIKDILALMHNNGEYRCLSEWTFCYGIKSNYTINIIILLQLAAGLLLLPPHPNISNSFWLKLFGLIGQRRIVKR